MLNETRIKLMTRMASYEATESKKNTSVAKHFRSDYVGLQIIKAIICATLACMIVFGAYICYDIEKFMANLYKPDYLWDFAAKVLKYYVVITVSYCVLVYIAFTVKYSKAKASLKRYFNTLRLLGKIYVKEDSEEEMVSRDTRVLGTADHKE